MTGLLELDDERTAVAGPERDPRRVVGAAVLAFAVALVVVIGGCWLAWSVLAGDDAGPGGESGPSRADLVAPEGAGPIHVPVTPPEAASTSEEAVFALTVERRPGDVGGEWSPEWVARYDVTLDGFDDEVQVVQWAEAPKVGDECASSTTPLLTWSVDTTFVAICSDTLAEEAPLLEYFADVEWTSDLDRVDWLRD
ncbi:hypothetical protein [Nocardioides yefusunii]|uniref:Uncharacterized protein n=1 Tax=Nocardioides yefusunii TaxID=2500546 RepID=A0ABW1QYS5_9ACTN|nr:hypothetical protein [Nocardioides yefusunii]